MLFGARNVSVSHRLTDNRRRAGSSSHRISPTVVRWLFILILLLSGIAMPGCVTLGIGKITEPTVRLTWHEKSTRCAILIRDLDVKVEIREPDRLPYSPDANGAIFIGTRMPLNETLEAIRFARYYYLGIRYVALSDYVHPDTDYYEYEMLIGASTNAALCLGLTPWTEADFNRLESIQSQEELRALIESHYEPDNRLCAQ